MSFDFFREKYLKKKFVCCVSDKHAIYSYFSNYSTLTCFKNAMFKKSVIFVNVWSFCCAGFFSVKEKRFVTSVLKEKVSY